MELPESMKTYVVRRIWIFVGRTYEQRVLRGPVATFADLPSEKLDGVK